MYFAFSGVRSSRDSPFLWSSAGCLAIKFDDFWLFMSRLYVNDKSSFRSALKYWILTSFVFSWILRHFSLRVFGDYPILCLQVKGRISIRIASVINIIARWCSQHHRPKVLASISVEPLTVFGCRYEFLVNHKTCKNREEWKEALLDVKDWINLIIWSSFVMVRVRIGAVVHHPTWSMTVTIVLSRFSKCRENQRFLIERGLVQPLKKCLTA